MCFETCGCCWPQRYSPRGESGNYQKSQGTVYTRQRDRHDLASAAQWNVLEGPGANLRVGGWRRESTGVKSLGVTCPVSHSSSQFPSQSREWLGPARPRCPYASQLLCAFLFTLKAQWELESLQYIIYKCILPLNVQTGLAVGE